MIDNDTRIMISIEGMSIVETTKGIISRFNLFPIDKERYLNREISFKKLELKFLEKKIRPLIGNELYNKLLQNEPMDEIKPFLQLLSQFYTSGYLLGKCLSNLFEYDDKRSRLYDFCAIIYLTSCLSDYIIDNYSQFFPNFINNMNQGLKKQFKDFQIQSIPNISQTIDSYFDELIISIVDHFLSTIREICLSKNIILLKELKFVMELSLNAQIIRYKNIEVKFSSIKEIYDFLRIRNSFLAWGIGLICLINTKNNIEKFSYWKELFLDIGDIFWLIDDITDYAEDYLNKKWNYVILRALSNRDSFVNINFPNILQHKFMYCHIQENLIIHDCIYEMFVKLNEVIEVFEESSHDSSCFFNLVYRFMKQHLYQPPPPAP